MTPADAAELLTIAAAFDRRKIGRADALAWADALAGLDPNDCAEAVRAHFRESTEYLMPVHVRQGVHRIRSERVKRAYEDIPELDAVADDPLAYQRTLKAHRARVASGWVPPEVEKPSVRAAQVRALVERTIESLPAVPEIKDGEIVLPVRGHCGRETA